MSFWELCSQQIVLFILMLIGLILTRRKVITEEGTRVLTDLCIQVIIPCNIIKSFMIEFSTQVLVSCGLLFVIALAMQLIGLLLNKFLFNRFPPQQKKILQYCSIISNGGFLGTPVAEGIYGDTGLMYASVFLIPMRIMMWSAGTGYFVAGGTDRRKVIKNVLTHPCLVGVYIGLILMITQLQLPSVIEKPIRLIGNCNSAITMFVIGTILAKMEAGKLFDRTSLLLSLYRLVILPGIALLLCLLLKTDPTASGVSVVMTGMPAAAMTAVFAARYGSDAEFATKCVVLSTLLSMITIPLWVYAVQAIL